MAMHTASNPTPYEFESFQRFRYQRVDASIESRRACVAMVVRTCPGQRLEGFGSGFFYRKAGWPYFITAKHVLDEIRYSIENDQLPFLLVRGRKGLIALPGVEFLALDELDLAVVKLWRLPASTYAHVDFFTDVETVTPTSSDYFAFTGFPVSSNKTYTGQEPKPKQRNVMLTSGSGAFSTSEPFLQLPIVKKGMHDSELRRLNINFPDGLSGMSGGSLLAVRGTLEIPTLHLCGIGLSWGADSVLNFLRMDFVDQWLENFLAWSD